LWIREFAGDPSIVGRTIRLDGRPARVIGIMPRRFSFPSAQELWTPLAPTAAARARETPYAQYAYATLAACVAIPRARSDRDAIGRAQAREHPLTNADLAPIIKAFDDWFLGANLRALYRIVWGAAAFVLLVIVANVANLLLDQASGRSRATAIQLALG